MPSRSAHALVPAAGSGERFGSEIPKQFVRIADRPVLGWAIDALLQAGIDGVVAAVPPRFLATAPQEILDDERVRWVEGGKTRQESVARCLSACKAEDADLIAIHDGARPLVHPEDVGRTLKALETGGVDGAVLGRPVTDTLKLSAEGTIQGTVERRYFFRAETPQIFPRELFAKALYAAEKDGVQGTDEASLVERVAGARVAAVEARHPNPKLTERADLELIAALLQGRGRA